jgi:hypothetical protein
MAWFGCTPPLGSLQFAGLQGSGAGVAKLRLGNPVTEEPTGSSICVEDESPEKSLTDAFYLLFS